MSDSYKLTVYRNPSASSGGQWRRRPDGAEQQHPRPACGHSGVALGNADCADLWIVPTSSLESSAEQTLRSARSAQSGRPPGFDTKWMALRVPAWGRNVMCQCFHPSPTTRRSGQQDGLLRARSGLAAQLRRATRTGLCQRRRYESPCCAADAATRVGTIGVVATSENAESGQVARTGVRASRDQVGQDVI